MPLRYYFEDITDAETLCWVDTGGRMGKQVAPVTDTLIWLTITIGINHISEKNVEEFIARVAETEALLGASMSKWEEGGPMIPRPVTAEEIRAHIGLRTNASPKTKTAWRRDIQAIAARAA